MKTFLLNKTIHTTKIDTFSKKNKFIETIQKSRLSLTACVLRSFKKRIEVEHPEKAAQERINSVSLPVVMNTLKPFGTIKYNINKYLDKESVLKLVYVPGGIDCELYQNPKSIEQNASLKNSSARIKMLDDLLMSESDITEELWLNVMNAYPASYNKRFVSDMFLDIKNPNNPITCMNLREAKTFCNKLSEMCGLQPCYVVINKSSPTPSSLGVVTDYEAIDITANGFRLPTLIEYLHVAKTGYTIEDYLGYILANCNALKKMKCVNMKSETAFSHNTVEDIPVSEIEAMFADIINIDTIKDMQGNGVEELFAFCFNSITPQVLCEILENINPKDIFISRGPDGKIVDKLNLKDALRKMDFKSELIRAIEKHECLGALKLSATRTKIPNEWGFYDATANVRKLSQNTNPIDVIEPSDTDNSPVKYSDYLKKEYETVIIAKNEHQKILNIDLKGTNKRVLMKQMSDAPFVVFGETAYAEASLGYCSNMFLNSNKYGLKPNAGMMQQGIQRGSSFKIVKQIPKDPNSVGY